MANDNEVEKTKIINKKSLYDFFRDHQVILVIATLIFAAFSYYSSRSIKLEYAIISKDGTLAYQKNFGSYGLFPEKKQIVIPNTTIDNSPSPVYLLIFNKEPDYFEITNRNALLVAVTHIDINKYMVKFYGTGGFLGNSIVESEFKIQAY